jgi:hypothetical protein
MTSFEWPDETFEWPEAGDRRHKGGKAASGSFACSMTIFKLKLKYLHPYHYVLPINFYSVI